MSPSKFAFILLLGIAVVATGCQQKTPRDRTRIGRDGRASSLRVNPNGYPTPFGSGSYSTQWGEVTNNNQQMFQEELFYFTSPMLNGASPEDSVGYVSAQAGQQTGVVFWGEAAMRGNGAPGMMGQMSSGQLDGSRARLHIEIFDDKTGMTRSDGSVRPQIFVHIGYDQEGFVGAQGSVQGNQVNLVFTDNIGSVIMQGTINQQYFTGQMSYTVNGQQRPLGNFKVPACGFFVCN
ncbi:MAG: hypothetical protein KF799_06265 [Bdellovibrionales bacterium]|nr:hypothetical protein [Bdellovibrionales bacterium]